MAGCLGSSLTTGELHSGTPLVAGWFQLNNRRATLRHTACGWLVPVEQQASYTQAHRLWFPWFQFNNRRATLRHAACGSFGSNLTTGELHSGTPLVVSLVPVEQQASYTQAHHLWLAWFQLNNRRATLRHTACGWLVPVEQQASYTQAHRLWLPWFQLNNRRATLRHTACGWLPWFQFNNRRATLRHTACGWLPWFQFNNRRATLRHAACGFLGSS